MPVVPCFFSLHKTAKSNLHDWAMRWTWALRKWPVLENALRVFAILNIDFKEIGLNFFFCSSPDVVCFASPDIHVLQLHPVSQQSTWRFQREECFGMMLVLNKQNRLWIPWHLPWSWDTPMPWTLSPERGTLGCWHLHLIFFLVLQGLMDAGLAPWPPWVLSKEWFYYPCVIKWPCLDYLNKFALP